MRNHYDQVKELLTQYPSLRDDDMKLYGMFLWQNQCVAREETFYRVLGSARDRNLPSYESVTRARRKVQEKEPELRGTRYAERRKEETEYHDFYSEN